MGGSGSTLWEFMAPAWNYFHDYPEGNTLIGDYYWTHAEDSVVYYDNTTSTTVPNTFTVRDGYTNDPFTMLWGVIYMVDEYNSTLTERYTDCAGVGFALSCEIDNFESFTDPVYMDTSFSDIYEYPYAVGEDTLSYRY